jgi:sugar (pentulose or hexulose) kinase
MSSKYLAGIDIGTTGAKAMLFDLSGSAAGSAYRDYPCQYPRPNWVEQDADLVVESALSAMRDAIRQSGVPAADIASVSVSAQRCCGIFLDAGGRQLRPMISWQDNRTPAEVEEIAARIAPAEYYRRTGFPNGTTWLLSKLLWVRKHEPAVWERLERVVQMHDYFLHALGVEEYFVDHNDAGFFGLFDSTACTWDRELLGRFELAERLLPVPAASGTLAGRVSAAGSDRSGLRAGTKIAIGAGDQCAGAMGAGIVHPGDLSISMGTAGAVTAFLDHPFRDPGGHMFVTNHGMQGRWLLEGHQAAAASVYRWFRDEVAALERQQAAASGRDAFDLLNDLAATAPAGSKGLLLLPYFASAATPRYNPHARGALLGLTFAHDKACLARAFMEGITLDMKDMIEAMRRAGVSARHVRVLGGPTRSPLWNQIQADTYDTVVQTLRISDATLLGAAMLGAVAAGEFGSIPEAAESMVRVDRTFEPRPDTAALYADMYQAYCRSYEALHSQGVFRDMARLQGS